MTEASGRTQGEDAGSDYAKRPRPKAVGNGASFTTHP